MHGIKCSQAYTRPTEMMLSKPTTWSNISSCSNSVEVELEDLSCIQIPY